MHQEVGACELAPETRLCEAEEDVISLIDEMVSFVRDVIEPLEDRHAGILSNPREMYREDGMPVSEYKEIRRQARTASAEAGYYTVFSPYHLGGRELGAVGAFLAYETLYREFGPGRALVEDVLGAWNRGPSQIIDTFSPAVRDRVGPRLMTGEEIFSFGLSEPDTGSDAWAMKTRAEKVPDGWRINGVKKWISDAPYADHVLVFAVTDPAARDSREGGISAFLVPTASQGIRVTNALAIFGDIGGTRSEIVFENLWVPDELLVGKAGDALEIARSGVSLGRIYNAGRAVGMSRWALQLAATYASQRETFGQAIANYQAIQFMLADSMMETYAAYSMALNCTRRIDRGNASAKLLAMVKAYACERSFEILDRCMQIHGGMGFVNETRLYAGWHQARVLRVADGSSEILRRSIAREILRGDLSL